MLTPRSHLIPTGPPAFVESTPRHDSLRGVGCIGVRTLALAAALGLPGAGCAQTHKTHNVAVPVSAADLSKLRTEVRGKTAAIAYWHAEGAKPGAIAFRPKVIQGTVYVEPFVLRLVDGGKAQSIPHSHVNMIQRVDHRRGMAQGGGTGALVGIVLGGVTGYFLGTDCSAGGICIVDRTEAAASLGLTGGAIGLLAGVLAGNSSGSIDDWLFVHAAWRQ
jgi:hypothetical protein